MRYQNKNLFNGEIIDTSEFKLDQQKQEIVTCEATIRLRSKLWKMLTLFLKNESRLIKRDDLIDCLWQGNYFTGPQGVNHSVCHLRRIFKQLAIPLQIITIPKQGYILQTEKKYMLKF